MRLAVYPGSFDPVTRGHLDVIERAAQLFDVVVVAVAVNSQKTSLFSIQERADLMRKATLHLPSIQVATLDGLLVDFAKQQGASAVVRGLRAVSDFEFEFQMALMNRKLAPEIETVFLAPKEDYSYVSSRLVKEVARLGGEVSEFVPPHVFEALKEKFNLK